MERRVVTMKTRTRHFQGFNEWNFHWQSGKNWNERPHIYL